MSNKYYCDRCGAHIEYAIAKPMSEGSQRNVGMWLPTRRPALAFRQTGEVKDMGTQDMWEPVDVCDVCIEALRAWWIASK